MVSNADYVLPADLMTDALKAAEKKATLSIRSMVLRGGLSGALLAFATAFAWKGIAGIPPSQGSLIAGLVFPVGFAMITLLGLELVTGNFAILTLGVLRGKVSLRDLIKNWSWVMLGNLIGSIFFGVLLAFTLTNGSFRSSDPLGQKIVEVAVAKTTHYAESGAAGWWTAFIKGVLCNWMVAFGSVLGMTSRSAVGKVVAIWLPISIFFALGFEHSVVNMFVIPTGILLGAKVTIAQWLIWNQLPVTLGNILGAALLVAATLHFSQPIEEKKNEVSTSQS
ncbi:MAG: formate/nitrite transporter family protein [Armatimonadota bacterium]